MAEFSFLFPIAGKLLEILGSPLIQKIGSAWGVKNELEKLKNTLSSVHAVLLDAEDKQEGNHQLKDWLGKLKAALSQADDLLDDFQIHSFRRQNLDQTFKGKVTTFLSPDSNQLIFRFKMGQKIRKLRKLFDEIAANRTKFNLVQRLVETKVVMHREMTHSFIDESDIVGRYRDKENIVNLLMQTGYDEKLSVIPIIGMGGLGKTTLAKMVYNDKRVVEYFDLRIWACISDDFDLKVVLVKLLKSITGEDSSNLDVDQLQIFLREKLHDRKYLLILDDVWNENRAKWIELMDHLKGCRSGSKIIVTARSDLVASVVAPITRKYKLQVLSNKDCLSTLLNWAFWKREDANQHPNLVKIGAEIVNKCKGVPLAVRTLGKLLYLKTEESYWVYVRDNDMWKLGQEEDDILPALKLSYNQLPSHLKQCFAYCSLFPKDYKYCEIELIGNWRAHGLIRAEKNRNLEDIGKEYIQLLLSRGFFQDPDDTLITMGFKMHDLVHDLAQSVAKPDCISICSSDIFQTKISKKVQHLSFTTSCFERDEIPVVLEEINHFLELKHVHSLLFHVTQRQKHPSFDPFMETFISRLTHLRVLRFKSFRAEELPTSIGSLLHLRFLDLSQNHHITSLPDSLCNLWCLETLYLWGCRELEKLPVGFGKLIRLKCLRLTTKERCLPGKEIKCLTALQILWIYKCRHMESILSNEEMKCLSGIRTLVIAHCSSLVSLPTRGFQHLHRLEKLYMSDCRNLDFSIDDHLHPGQSAKESGLSSLQFLSIHQMPKLKALPVWLVQGASSLKDIFVTDCLSLTILMPEPQLLKLQCLQRIEIVGCPLVKNVPSGICLLTALNEISFEKCPELVRKCQRGTGEDWNKISHIPYIFLDEVKI